jgi:flavocytochrome c
MHTSTTTHIALKYKPPSKKMGRVDWAPNPEYFMKHLGSNPERIKNLHFSFVVMLRALKKASPHLYNYDFSTGDDVEDARTKFLVQRLLDSHVLQSCSSVFNAFDESLLFQKEIAISGTDSVNASSLQTLKSNFKGVFHNISTVLDCVTCQKCKLHGKLNLLGLGTALKTLLLPDNLLAASLSRNEIVAFINTLVAFSDAIEGVNVLTTMFWSNKGPTSPLSTSLPTQAAAVQTKANDKPSQITSPPIRAEESLTPFPSVIAGPKISDADTRFTLMNNALALIARLGEAGDINSDVEDTLVQLVLSRHTGMLALANAYGANPRKFYRHALNLLNKLPEMVAAMEVEPDAIVVGAGLAGLTSTLRILDRGGTVVLMDKEHRLGGNSAKASSGINGYVAGEDLSDSLERFHGDTTKSAKDGAMPHLINTLTAGSSAAISWLKERIGVDLSQKAQLGGHTAKRTFRPNNGMAGAEIMYLMGKRVREFEASGRLTVLVDSMVTDLIPGPNGNVVGVNYIVGNKTESLHAKHVVLTSGGFASDRSPNSYLAKHRPELLSYPTTAGDWSTGDGIRMAKVLDADTLHMDKVQVHPTGFVDPTNPRGTTKTLAAELLRGVGGILLDPKQNASRFCNELGTRQAVVDRMLAQWNLADTSEEDRTPFVVLLGAEAAAKADRHVGLYSRKGLLNEFTGGVRDVAAWMHVDKHALEQTIHEYNKAAVEGTDDFGKQYFFNSPIDPNAKMYAGQVVPVLHYCMGGLKINEKCEVLKTDGLAIEGLYAAGETAGGVHGYNRLAGNSLLECVVFGSIVGETLPIQSKAAHATTTPSSENPAGETTSKQEARRSVSQDELAFHKSSDDCWVSIKGTVYDFTDFLEEHPAGAESILKLGGTEGAAAFFEVHNEGMLDDFEDSIIGFLEAA